MTLQDYANRMTDALNESTSTSTASLRYTDTSHQGYEGVMYEEGGREGGSHGREKREREKRGSPCYREFGQTKQQCVAFTGSNSH